MHKRKTNFFFCSLFYQFWPNEECFKTKKKEQNIRASNFFRLSKRIEQMKHITNQYDGDVSLGSIFLLNDLNVMQNESRICIVENKMFNYNR